MVAPPQIFDARLVAASEHCIFQVAKLSEETRGMVANATEVPVVGRAFLVAVGLADRTVHVEDQFTERSIPMHGNRTLALDK